MFHEDDRDEPPDTAVVRIEAATGSAALSKSQKAFNRLIAKIEGQRQLLASWQAFVPEFQTVLSQELEPLQKRIDAQRLALAQLFDAAHEGRGVNKRERAKLADLISGLCADLLSRSEDPVVVALHDKYSEVSHGEAQQDEADFLKSMAQGVFGIDLPDDELPQSPEELMEAIARKMQQRAETGAATAAADGEADGQAAAGRRKSAKARAREAREQAQAQGVTQSVREVYRKLASALHPDRETDPAERERKTALMQRVNQAYDKKDLLQLLTLQMQAEQIDATRLGEVGETRLKHYIAVLKEQARELEQELMEVTHPFAMGMGPQRGGVLTPRKVLQSVRAELADSRRELQQLNADLVAFQNLRELKGWLKYHRIDRSELDDPFGDGLDEVFGDAFVDGVDDMFAPAPRAPRRRR